MSNPQRPPTLNLAQLTQLFIRQTSPLQKVIVLPMIMKSLETCDFDHLRVQFSAMMSPDASPLDVERLYDALSMIERWVNESKAHVARGKKSTVDISDPLGDTYGF